ncbi:MAG: purine-nucleoside phosphorylase, partial [Akkermansiaceae bacterium]|nr:purine-nucleoside phosphorylase [Akkermansiaceae bacterium]
MSRALGPLRPEVAIVLGSGLGGLASAVDDSTTIPYEQIPGFPQPTVAGHGGFLIAAEIEGVPAILQSGRF